jgi:hypothetical protein
MEEVLKTENIEAVWESEIENKILTLYMKETVKN